MSYEAVIDARKQAECWYKNSTVKKVVELRYDRQMAEGAEAAGINKSLYETLYQLAKGPIFDGNLINKQSRDELVSLNMCDRFAGWNFLTAIGISACIKYSILKV